jgi:NAD(P)-dependent dehydrogenase (short-subunit alcohol dehydrogenase family)
MGRMDRKVAGARGVLMYAREGAKVVVTGRKDDKGREVVAEIAEQGGDTFVGQADVAYACVFRGSDESAFITGSLITIDGGLTIGAAPRLPRR